MARREKLSAVSGQLSAVGLSMEFYPVKPLTVVPMPSGLPQGNLRLVSRRIFFGGKRIRFFRHGTGTESFHPDEGSQAVRQATYEALKTKYEPLTDAGILEFSILLDMWCIIAQMFGGGKGRLAQEIFGPISPQSYLRLDSSRL